MGYTSRKGNLPWQTTPELLSLANVFYLFGPKLTLFAKVSYPCPFFGDWTSCRAIFCLKLKFRNGFFENCDRAAQRVRLGYLSLQRAEIAAFVTMAAVGFDVHRS